MGAAAIFLKKREWVGKPQSIGGMEEGSMMIKLTWNIKCKEISFLNELELRSSSVSYIEFEMHLRLSH